MYFAVHIDILHIYAEMGNTQHQEMQLEFQNLRNLTLFETTPPVGRTGRNCTEPNDTVITQMI